MEFCVGRSSTYSSARPVDLAVVLGIELGGRNVSHHTSRNPRHLPRSKGIVEKTYVLDIDCSAAVVLDNLVLGGKSTASDDVGHSTSRILLLLHDDHQPYPLSKNSKI
jgi:hypothetical protein